MYNPKSLPVLIVLAVTGILTLLAATRFGIGISPDSVRYIDAARNLLHGEGLRVVSGTRNELKPMTHYPPLYSCLLALPGAVGAELPSAARWLNALLFGANIFLAGFVIGTYARNSFWLPVFGSFLVLTAPDIAGIHSFALTEPLYLFLMMTGLLYLSIYIENQERRFLLASSVAVALSFVTRYVGVVSVLTGAVVLFAFDGRNLRRRLIDTAIFGAIACTPIGLWAIRNHFLAGASTDRQFVFHPVKLQQIVSGFSTVASWLLLGKVRRDIREIAFLIEAVAIIGLTIYLMGERKRTRIANDERTPAKLLRILSIFIVSYVAFLILSVSFIDVAIPFNDRMLVPVHVAALVLVSCLAWNLYHRSKQSRSIRIIFVVLALIFAGSYGVRGANWLVRTHRDGGGYASKAWKDSATIARLRTLPSGVPIYSNSSDAIYYLTGRRASYGLPVKIVYTTGLPNQNFSSQLERMRFDLRDHNGMLVYFYALSEERWFLPSESELKERLPLCLIVTTSDGSIYTVGR